MLAVLLLGAGRRVSAETLIDRVWGDDPPAGARKSLSTYVARLRTIIAVAADPAVTLIGQDGGYRLEVPPDRLDLRRFQQLVADAVVADADETAQKLLGEALSLWAGPALAGVDSPWLAAMRHSLELDRAAAMLDLNDVRLRLGQHAALAGELAAQATASPGDERLAGQLMLALYRSGRQAEALHWYQQTRRHLADELGADPGPELAALHQQILGAAPALTLRSAGRPPAAVPRELPADVSVFTGRAAELAELDKLLTRAGEGRRPAAAVISAVSGTAGVGKTALAVHWAHRAVTHFPDGQLYVNLRGYDPAAPVHPADALAGFLQSLGVPGADIPPEHDQRAASYRSLLAGQRMLIVLDNAGSVEQVRPLLPRAPGCAVLVTSRDALAGLVARDGAVRLDLDLLSLDESVSLLRDLIGASADEDPAAIAQLAAQCCRLPLALRIAAELAAARPGTPLAELVSELADQQRRLDLLDADGDPRTTVRAVFSWSYRQLAPGTARAFRLLGLHSAVDFDAYAVAALADTTLDQAKPLLGILSRAHLIQPTAPGRFGMHDLLRAYARELAAAEDQADARCAALTRLFDYYLYTATAATDALYPAGRLDRPLISQPSTPAPPVTGAPAALSWLDAHRAALVAVTTQATTEGWAGHATRLADTLFRYLDGGGHLAEARVVYGQAQVAARQAGDLIAQARALNCLAGIDWRQGRYQEAASRLRDCLAMYSQAGDQQRYAATLANLGQVDYERGNYGSATDLLQRALAVHRRLGGRSEQVVALAALGNTEERQGHYDQAAEYHQQCLALAREIADKPGEAMALSNIGVIEFHRRHYERAAEQFRLALARARELGNRAFQATALENLGSIERQQGRCGRAAELHLQALAIYREAGEPASEAAVLNDLAAALLADGRPGDALARHAEALRLATRIGARHEQARAHHGLGRAYHAADRPNLARQHWQTALDGYADLGAPEADEVRAQLAALGEQEA